MDNIRKIYNTIPKIHSEEESPSKKIYNYAVKYQWSTTHKAEQNQTAVHIKTAPQKVYKNNPIYAYKIRAREITIWKTKMKITEDC